MLDGGHGEESRCAGRPDTLDPIAEACATPVAVVPAALVGQVRGGVYLEMRAGLEEAKTLIEEPDRDNPARREQLVGLLARVDGARALLDRLRWTAAREETRAEIDLHQYHGALQAALAAQIAAEEECLREASEDEEERLREGSEDEPARPSAERPAEALRGLLEEIGADPGDTGERPGERCVLHLLLLPDEREPGESDRARWWSVAEIEARLGDRHPAGVRFAVDGLVAQGAAVRNGERVRVSPCALHIKAIGATGV